MVATVTQQIGDEMAVGVGMDPIIAVALIQALMQTLVVLCRGEPMKPEDRMVYLANHRPQRIKGFVRRRGRKLGLSESEIGRVKNWIVPAIKRSDLKTRKALCADAAVPS